MARKPRHLPAGRIYHVLNRSAGRIALFRKVGDYEAFLRIVVEAHARVPLPILDFCLMKNHWHFVVHPTHATQVTDFFRWLTHTHAMRWRVARDTVGWGHLYQGRFKAFAVQSGGPFLMVARYVQRNALSAGVVKRAEDWPYGSLHVRREGSAELRGVLAPWPVRTPADWVKTVNMPLTSKELSKLSQSVSRQAPYGDAARTVQTAEALGVEHSLRREGRPRKVDEAVNAGETKGDTP